MEFEIPASGELYFCRDWQLHSNMDEKMKAFLRQRRLVDLHSLLVKESLKNRS